MTRRGTPGDGLDVELLAELDAGLVTGPRAARLRAAALADPAAAAVLAGLAATRAELAAMPTPPMPPGLTDRCLAAVAADAGAARPVLTTSHTGWWSRTCRGVCDTADRRATWSNPGSSHGPPAGGTVGRVRRWSSRRRRRPPTRRVIRPALVAAAVIAAVVGHRALLPSAADGPSIDRVGLAAAARSAVGSDDLGALADPARRSACLRAVPASGVGPTSPLIGGRRVQLAGRPAVLLVFPAGRLGVFRAVVVDPECGPDGGTLLDTALIGD